jgi:quercetin dioxygenase-like cupin family protein
MSLAKSLKVVFLDRGQLKRWTLPQSPLSKRQAWVIPENEYKAETGWEEKMKVVKMSHVPREPNASSLFTGKDVTHQPLVSESKNFRMAIVNFGKGVRNKFHTHSGDQILIITAGKGIVATETEQKSVTVGDVVLFPAGEKHWHGATPDTELSHITIQIAGSKTAQLES